VYSTDTPLWNLGSFCATTWTLTITLNGAPRAGGIKVAYLNFDGGVRWALCPKKVQNRPF
jgi:hypothetical protein